MPAKFIENYRGLFPGCGRIYGRGFGRGSGDQDNNFGSAYLANARVHQRGGMCVRPGGPDLATDVARGCSLSSANCFLPREIEDHGEGLNQPGYCFVATHFFRGELLA